MTNETRNLSQALTIKFGLGPNEPTQSQLNQIVAEMEKIYRPSVSDWHKVVYKYCPTAGSFKYAGIDNSDLNTLLTLAINAGGRKQP